MAVGSSLLAAEVVSVIFFGRIVPKMSPPLPHGCFLLLLGELFTYYTRQTPKQRKTPLTPPPSQPPPPPFPTAPGGVFKHCIRFLRNPPPDLVQYTHSPTSFWFGPP